MNADGTRTAQQYMGKSLFCSTGDYTTDGVGGTGALGQLNRIQSMEWSVEYPLQQPSYLNSATEAYLQHPGSISINLRWDHTQGRNESLLGLAQQLVSGVLTSNLEAEKNLYMTVENGSYDAIGEAGGESHTTIGFSQGVMTQYAISAAVGGLIEASASISYLSSFIYSGGTGLQIPSVVYQDGSQVAGTFTLPPASSQYTAVQPSGYLSTGATDYDAAVGYRDLIMTFPQGSPFGVLLTGAQSCFLQSFTCTLGIARQELKPLGYVYPSHRPIQWPITVDLTTDAIVSNYVADQLGRINCLASGQWANIIVKQPCSNATLFGLYFDNLQLVGQQFSTSIGRNDVVTLHWRGVISNPYQVFYDPTINYIIRLDNSGAWGVGW